LHGVLGGSLETLRWAALMVAPGDARRRKEILRQLGSRARTRDLARQVGLAGRQS
jgi:hypothetical protein